MKANGSQDDFADTSAIWHSTQQTNGKMLSVSMMIVVGLRFTVRSAYSGWHKTCRMWLETSTGLVVCWIWITRGVLFRACLVDDPGRQGTRLIAFMFVYIVLQEDKY